MKALLKRSLPPTVASLLGRVRSNFRRRHFHATSPNQRVNLFSDVYRKNFWGNEESRSGNGSDHAQTALLRDRLSKLVSELGAKSMLDVPCGDFLWMSQADIAVDAYTGGDIVPELVLRLQELHGAVGREFRQLDLLSDDLPTVDLIFCRDALVHFSNADVTSALSNMKRSGSEYLMTTTFTARGKNPDIATGGNWRPLNLQCAPFRLPPPLRLLNEGCTEAGDQFADKSLGVWRIRDI